MPVRVNIRVGPGADIGRAGSFLPVTSQRAHTGSAHSLLVVAFRVVADLAEMNAVSCSLIRLSTPTLVLAWGSSGVLVWASPFATCSSEGEYEPLLQ